MQVIKKFNTPIEAQAFAKGVEYVDDPSVGVERLGDTSVLLKDTRRDKPPHKTIKFTLCDENGVPL